LSAPTTIVPPRVAPKEATAQGDDNRNAEARSGLVGIHRPHLDGEFFFARISVANEFL
jgi:hypothetical protein